MEISQLARLFKDKYAEQQRRTIRELLRERRPSTRPFGRQLAAISRLMDRYADQEAQSAALDVVLRSGGAARVVQERLLHVGRQTPLSVRQRRPEQDTAAAAGGAVQEGALRRPRGHRRAVPVPQVRPDDRVPALQQPQDAAVAPQRPLRRVEQLLYSAPVLARAQGAVHLERRGPRVVRILLAAPRTVGAPGQLRKPVRQPDALLRRLGQEDVVRVCRQRDVHCRRVAEIHQKGPAAPKQAGRVRARRHASIH
ncbi:hypothetical protein KL911_002150 [Ogataea haglerorum]|uniref:uncharacterized protein n=1 Tax=Ogataea haglerorum TaxID=1937702 RepID=UPI001C8AF46F|nr:uncharacterized protein KL911_002150 [Ogataea haglerorum]KAG7754711.1 hypothetical protein KL911_002150 [Ogataea haglerorum]